MIDKSMDALVWLRKQLETGGNDLLREMVRSFAEGLMGAEADLVCGASYRVVSPDRTNRRNGYRSRRWDTRVGTIDLRILKVSTFHGLRLWFRQIRATVSLPIPNAEPTNGSSNVSTRPQVSLPA